MADPTSDRSQDATPHRRQQAREEGQVAHSQDLGSAVLLIAGLVVLLYLGGGLVSYFAALAQQQLGGAAWVSAERDFVLSQYTDMLLALAKVLLPILGVLVAAAVAVNVAQVGFLFLPSRLALDFSRIDPLQGLQRLFSLATAARLTFGIFKVIVVATVGCLILYQRRTEILSLTGLELPQIAAFLVDVVLWTSFKIGLVLLVLALLDYGFQYWKHEQDLKMTPQDVREEMRNLQGDPQILAKRRALQRQMVLNRLSSVVPKADVVITNPTELAVALQYEPGEMNAPIVVAKGAGAIAQRIRRLALEHGVPIVEKKPLAQMLYKEVDVNHPISDKMYAAVAEVLAYVYQLKHKPLPIPESK